ncbi:hypothetical protein SPI_01417 [Niveomyces insectorum RCEF 264]|uniref:Uncharacterized protein n=1 Tax=Niveomyces insectorum RCEF 264 TaxID=1081102 RepID=A0A167YY84_9HYPO|nr:hypothetical protein SPI_01417 [Niveomyces insectorum RCEF 264]
MASASSTTSEVEAAVSSGRVSMGGLIRRINEFQQSSHLEAIARMRADNGALVARLSAAQSPSVDVMVHLANRLEGVHEALHRAIATLSRETAAADERWLAYWSSGAKSKGSGPHAQAPLLPDVPGGWI